MGKTTLVQVVTKLFKPNRFYHLNTMIPSQNVQHAHTLPLLLAFKMWI